MGKQIRTYRCYRRGDGSYTGHWQWRGEPKLPDCLMHGLRVWGPPESFLEARATSARQAAYFANEGIHAERDENGQFGLGIVAVLGLQT